MQTRTWPSCASEPLRLTTNYHLQRSCYLVGRYKTIYPEKSKVTKPVMTLSTDCKYNYDQHTATLPSLVHGERVTIQNPRTLKWDPAVVLNKVEGVPRSYTVSTPSGKQLRRNRSQIRQIPQGSPKQVKFDLRRNQVHRFSPEVEHGSPIMQSSQPSPRSSPRLGTAHSAHPAQETVQPIIQPPEAARSVGVNSTPTDGGQYVTLIISGRTVKAPVRMDI